MKLRYQFELLKAIRNFFDENGFIDVITPPVVQNPGMETHIHPFKVDSVHNKGESLGYLHTSPEFEMKKILSNKEFEKIFNISYCFRDEPHSVEHRQQFLMLEWYRKNEFYTQIMEDIRDLIISVQDHFQAREIPLKREIDKFIEITVSELFNEFASFDILDFLEKENLKQKIYKDFPDIPMPDADCSWDDYYFLIFLNKIEPQIRNYPYLLIKDFPAPLAALSTINKDDKRVCDRFEVYLSGVELCNSFNEETDKEVLEKRFRAQAQEKKELYGYELPWPEDFMKTMDNYPKSSGIALGVERLLMSVLKVDNPFYT